MGTKTIEERFMMGKAFDSLGIRSYLDIKSLIEKRESLTNSEIYFLKENQGKISLNYNKYFNTLQVIISQRVPAEIVNDLKEIGKQSRLKLNKEKYGVPIY